MEEIFRFVHLRAPQTPVVFGLIAITLRRTVFIERVVALRASTDGDAQVNNVLDAFFLSSDFLGNVDEIDGAAPLMRLRSMLRAREEMAIGDLAEEVATLLGRSVEELMRDTRLDTLEERASNAVLALKLKGKGQPPVLANYVDLIRIIDILRQISVGPTDALINAGKLMRRSVAFPDGALPVFQVASATAPDIVVPEGEDRAVLVAELSELRRARDEMLSFRARDLSVREPDPDPARDPNRIAMRSALVLNPDAIMRVSTATANRLSVVNLDPSRDSVRTIVERLGDELRHLTSRVNAAPETDLSRITIGATSLPARGGRSFLPDFDLNFEIEEGPAVPDTVGLVKPSSVGDLLVTRQTIVRYTADEIGFIQNVMQSERHQRQTRRLERTEESFLSETETTREEERDVQTTDRFETSREAKETIKEDEQYKRGFTISGGYGKFVQSKLSLSKDSNNSTEESNQSATKYARDLTERVNSKVTERVREERRRSTIREFEENIEHTFDNTGGDGHVSGMYQWVDKVHEAQVFNYGIRMFFDIMIPEPAAFYLQALAAQAQAGDGLVRPRSFNLTPDDIDDVNYMDYAARFGASGIEPPPPEYKVRSATFDVDGNPEFPTSLYRRADGKVDLPSDYIATSATMTITWVIFPGADESPRAMVVIPGHGWDIALALHSTLPGDDIHRPRIYHFDEMALDDSTGSVPYTFSFYAVSSASVMLEVLCSRSPKHYQKWQLRTFEALKDASAQQHAAYSTKLAEQQNALGAGLPDRAPFQNRMIERGELKRNAVSIITGQYFTMFDAINASATQEARVDFEQALEEGEYARFFDQAFEWENMTYEFLDYFWARRSTWVRKLVETRDPDPDFEAFLTSGFARIRLPVTPDFEAAVLHYLETQEIWDGGELPAVVHEDYMPFLAEIAERRAAEPDEEVPVGAPFELRTPTKLVALRQAPGLPVWVRDSAGNYIPIEELEPEPEPADGP